MKTVWDFFDNNCNHEFYHYCDRSGGFEEFTGTVKNVCALNTVNTDRVIQWCKDNRDTMTQNKEHTAIRDYHEGETKKIVGYPRAVGYEGYNVINNEWSNTHELYELIGGKEAISQMGLIDDHLMLRLYVQLPGQFVPWHSDSMQAWRERNKDIKPHLVMPDEMVKLREQYGPWRAIQMASAKSKTTKGRIGRRIICLSNWVEGQFIQMGSQTLTGWRTGTVIASPPAIWHMTVNGSIVPRISMTVTGVLKPDVLY